MSRSVQGNKGTYSESDLVRELIALAPQHFGGRRCNVLMSQEVAVGRRIADVVLVFAGSKVKIQVDERFTVTESIVLWLLRQKRSTRIDLLEHQLGFDKGGLRNGALGRLEKWDVIQRGRGGQIRLCESWRTGFRVVAIEAKLTKWRQALHQAVAYKRFADEVYVVLPSDAAIRASARHDEFTAEGVGLIILDNRTCLETSIPAQANTTHDWQREFVLSRAIVNGRDKG